MNFPDDQTLLARGKYSTLGRERRAQLARAQKVCTTLMSACSQALRDCEAMPPVNGEPLRSIETCLKNLADCRHKIVELCAEMEVLKPIAWDGDAE